MEFIKRFIATEAAGGLFLMAAAVLALIAANTPLAGSYFAFTHASEIAVNDGLMAIFFLLIGMEIKRELTGGELSTWRKAALPVIGALGGVITPALIYVWFNHSDASAMRGWAVPTATDIAFSLGILSLFGARMPVALKIFLMAVAVIDDLIAIVIIAVFYTAELNGTMLLLAALCIAAILVQRRFGVRGFLAYVPLGLLLWMFVLHSGVHATIAGVLFAFLVPPSEKAEHVLHPLVAFAIMPLFAFANAGIPLAGIDFSALMEPLPLGIALGLFFGKQLGIFSFCRAAVALKIADAPEGVRWCQFYAVCMIAGIGFTMSLFIGTLAFSEEEHLLATRIGVLSGSLLSGVVGAMLLAASLRTRSSCAPHS